MTDPSTAVAMVVLLRDLVQEVRNTVEDQLSPSRSVSCALTKLDEAELWLARAAAEQWPDEPAPVPGRCGHCDHLAADHFTLSDDRGPAPCTRNACECAGYQ